MAVEVTREGAVAVVTVDRPEALNALNTATNQLLLAAVGALSADDTVRAVVLTGGGDKAFVAGADIAEMRGFTADEARRFGALGQAVTSAIEAAPQPWIAAVNGFALGGGCELALACDIRLAGEKAKFGQPEITLGITPGFGGTQRLPRTVGAGWAKYLVLSGRHLRADEALRIGLVQAVFAKDELMTQALKLAGELAARSPLAMRYCKAAVNAATDTDIATGQGIERDLFALAFASADQSEGMAAFLEKRAPEFRGR
ncbi:MAG: enoyl-CoA hydratase-related protein [Actinobacteria bacterium]|nr:enoyl-CoA hydratase-related protein [Actinomycetota bacterium]